MKIVVEKSVPFVAGVFESVADVEYIASKDINHVTLKNADALITRTRPYLGKDILGGTRLKIIATATIGTDHIDLDFCKRKGITVVNAPGCNAPAVAQWVYASIYSIIGDNILTDRPVLGVVGVGNVGSIVADWGDRFGFKVLRNDPPKELSSWTPCYSSLNKIVEEADIVTFHTPLTKSGPYPTYHLADNRFFSQLKKKPIILNASRGDVVDQQALLNAINEGLVSDVAIDCWVDEPNVSIELLERATIATPHIAGYSRQGKLRASLTCIKEVADFFGLKVRLPEEYPIPNIEDISFEKVWKSYNPTVDTLALRSNPGSFELLRNNYMLRDEVL